MERDLYDLPLATDSAPAAAGYRRGVDAILAAWPGGAEAFDQAIAADPAFALPWIARARLHQVYGEMTQAREKAARARELSATASPREVQHVAVLAAAVEGRPQETVTLGEVHLDQFPRDALVLHAFLGAYGLYAFSGRPDHDAARVALCERHARHYAQDDWWFLTYLGWSHTEAGNVAHGRALTERGLMLRRENANGAHALAHALFELGASSEAEMFLGGWLPGYSRKGILNGHLSWHQALLAIENGNAESVLSIYDKRIRPQASDAAPIHVFVDATSLLWRLSLDGRAGLEPHWREMAQYGALTWPRPGAAFVECHYALAAAATGDFDGLARRAAAFDELHAEGKVVAGAVLAAIYSGIRAFALNEYAEAIRILEPVMPEVVRVGGSHAQRELCEDTLIMACLRGGQVEKAKSLIDRRLHRRPSQRDGRWRHRAETAAPD